MNDGEHYPNAPITEAVIDLTVAPRRDVSLDDMARASETVHDSYPTRTVRSLVKGTIQLRDTISVEGTNRPMGFIMKTTDEKNVLQFRIDGFTLSRLAPYDRWASFRDEAKRLWVRYLEFAHPEGITRMALRYINRFDIPEPKIEMKDYFRTSPEVSPLLPQTMEGFFLRVALPQDDLAGHVIISQTIVPPAKENFTSVILDIDLFRDTDLPSDDASVWQLFERLRSRKNDVFEACITDLARRIIR